MLITPPPFTPEHYYGWLTYLRHVIFTMPSQPCRDRPGHHETLRHSGHHADYFSFRYRFAAAATAGRRFRQLRHWLPRRERAISQYYYGHDTLAEEPPHYCPLATPPHAGVITPIAATIHRDTHWRNYRRRANRRPAAAMSAIQRMIRHIHYAAEYYAATRVPSPRRRTYHASATPE